MKRLLFVLVLLLACPGAARAQDSQWGITIWGRSYHTDRSVDYDENNWGLGLRYYNKPDWHWLGRDEDNRLFAEADALRNSNRGLTVPLSLGGEFHIAPLPAGCRLFVVAALTAAYYQYPSRNIAVVKWGPVPGVAIGCGRHFRTNVMAVLRGESEPLAALTASVTIMF